jgi:hypothetical protein
VVTSYGIVFSAMACDCEVHVAADNADAARARARPAVDEVQRIQAK